MIRKRPGTQTPFDLGFEHGAETDEDASMAEMNSRVVEYKVGYVVGRSYSEAVKQANLLVGATVAGELGAKYGLSRDALVAAMRPSTEHEAALYEKYAEFRMDDARAESPKTL